jgi:hypothetical protein
VPDAALLADLYFPAAFSMLRNAQAQTITASSLITILINFSLAPDDYARRLGLLVVLGLRLLLLLLVDQRSAGGARL